MVFFKRKSFWQNTSIILGIYFFLFSSFFISFYFFDLIKYVQVLSAELTYKYPNDFNLKLWELTTANGFSEKYLRDEGVPDSIADFHGFTNAYKDGREILDYAEDNDLNLHFALTNKFKEKYFLDIEFETEETTNDSFVADLSYKFAGVKGKENYERENLFLEKSNQLNYRILSNVYLDTIDPINERIYKGGTPLQDANDLIVRNANLLISAINEKSNPKIDEQIIDQDPINTLDLTEEHIKNLWIKSVSFEKEKVIETKEDEDFKVGSTVFYIGNCTKEVSIDIFYSASENLYKFGTISDLISNLCLKPVSLDSIEYATCLICTFFPVDKFHALQSFYAPDVKQMIRLGSNFSISVDAYADLGEMLEAAKANGHNVQITSAYRSYANQSETFEYWVAAEIGNGFDRTQAEINANRYSARPGFSEHQLGTTVDLNSKDCDAFAAYCFANENFWMWLHDNAHLYGFVMSYPEHQEGITGYIYEPWHYRWLGEALAKEYRAQEGVLTLKQWLRAKELY